MIKNYTSGTVNTFDKIQKILALHKARRLMFDYGNDGKISDLSFSIDIEGKEVGFKLPANVPAVLQIFKDNGYRSDEKTQEQAYRTAWANIRDWLDAQMALVDTNQVKVEQVFLPYAVAKDGRTFFENMKDRQFQLPEPEEKTEMLEGEVVK